MTDINATNRLTRFRAGALCRPPRGDPAAKDVDSVDESAPATSMWADAWRTLRKNPMFIISGIADPVHPVRGDLPGGVHQGRTRTTAISRIPSTAPSRATPSASTCRAATSTPVWSMVHAPRSASACSPRSSSWLSARSSVPSPASSEDGSMRC